MDLECWMGCVKDSIQDKKLSHIVIPGSHDSGSYCINSHSKRTYLLPNLGSCLNPLVDIVGAPWAKTQPYSIAVQLKMGVRYIDLRVFLDTDINEFFLVHSFEAGTLRDEIKAIGDFVLSHPTEVIIVDMNHIYKCNEEDVVKILTLFEETFSDMLCPVPHDYPTDNSMPTYGQLITSGKRVIIAASENPESFSSCWDHSRLCAAFPWLWSSDKNIVSPWANTMKVDKLYSFLKATMAKPRTSYSLHVSQTILSPQTKDTVYGIVRSPSSVKQLSRILNPHLPSWYEVFNSSYGLNIAIVDYINADLIAFLVRLNQPGTHETLPSDSVPLIGVEEGAKWEIRKKKKLPSFAKFVNSKSKKNCSD